MRETKDAIKLSQFSLNSFLNQITGVARLLDPINGDISQGVADLTCKCELKREKYLRRIQQNNMLSYRWAGGKDWDEFYRWAGRQTSKIEKIVI